MKILPLLLCIPLTCLAATAQDHASHNQSRPATLVPGLSDLHHPVSTRNPLAQNFFDQGLRYIYSFNHEEAARSFERAAELDPNFAMAYWGIAEAVGPNYNDPADPARYQQAYAAIQKALNLSSTASPNEQSYIHAMSLRFPKDPDSDLKKAAEEYHAAMRQLVRDFPDDLDAATLFAEAGMNLHPWELWGADGRAAPGTDEIVATLESVIKRDPHHLGAIHYYIHAVEASPNPERALAPANRLPSIAPAAGHIVHMPAHIYARTGDYEASVKTNELAAVADRNYIQASGGAPSLYSMMYYSHNLHFIAISAAMNGNYPDAQKNADLLFANIAPHLKEMPSLEGFATIPLAVEIRFHHWDKILRVPQPDASLPVNTVFWHFARGLAFAGKGQLREADAEYKFVSDTEAATAPDLIFQMPITNKTKDILHIAKNVLGAKLAIARKDDAAAIAQLREAVALQDALKYNEPSDWFFPVRETLGAALLMNSDYPAAEKVFREDLERNPRNPRSLWGLQQSLLRQKREYDAGFIQRQFESSWKSAGPPLKLEDLV